MDFFATRELDRYSLKLIVFIYLHFLRIYSIFSVITTGNIIEIGIGKNQLKSDGQSKLFEAISASVYQILLDIHICFYCTDFMVIYLCSPTQYKQIIKGFVYLD